MNLVRSSLGAFFGALFVALAVALLGLQLEWFGFDGTLLFAAGGGAALGAVLGFFLPRSFLFPVLLLLETDLFED